MSKNWSKPIQPSSNSVIKFGKFSGLTVDQVPSDYLIWTLSNIEFKNPQLKKCIETELLMRCRTGKNVESIATPKYSYSREDDGYQPNPKPNWDPDDDIPF